MFSHKFIYFLVVSLLCLQAFSSVSWARYRGENADKMNYIERLEKCHISRSEGKYLIETHTGFIKENNIELGLKTKIHLFKN